MLLKTKEAMKRKKASAPPEWKCSNMKAETRHVTTMTFFFVPLLVRSKFIRKLKNVKIFQKKRINKTAKYLFRLFVAMWSSV